MLMPNPDSRSNSGRADRAKGPRYEPPGDVQILTLRELLRDRRSIADVHQDRLALGVTANGPSLWCAGDLDLIQSCVVAVVGTREVSPDGAARARKLGRQLAQNNVVVMSGLARGVDTEVLTSAVEHGGRVIAVIGTPVDRAYPAENTALQQEIAAKHLLISQFAPGARVFKGNFPERNKLMAALSDATVIIEAGETSGTLHQAVECVRLGRRLFIARSLMDDPHLQWPARFRHYPNVSTMTAVEDVISGIAECH
jgi:DNA processing protein